MSEHDDTPSGSSAETNVAPPVDVEETNPAPAFVPEPPAAPPKPSPIVVFEAVAVRDAAAPKRKSRGGLAGLTLALGPGVFVFLGAPEDGTIALSDVMTGTRPPLRGRVTIAGESPLHSARVRARMGVLANEPLLPAARTVLEAVAIAQQARGETKAAPLRVLELLGLDHLALRHPRSLAFAETRAVELALALSTPAPLLLALHDPLADVAVNLLGLVRERIRDLAQAACVIITTSSPADARALGDRVFVLHRGTIASEADAAEPLPGGSPQLVVWVRPAEPSEGPAPVRRLAQLLAGRPEISSVSWSEQDASPPHAAELRLAGRDLDACALALADAATEAGAVLEAIAPAAPGITRVRAAAETLETRLRVALAQRPPPAPKNVRGES